MLIIKRYNKLLNFIKNFPCGHDGESGKLMTLASFYEWHPKMLDDTDVSIDDIMEGLALLMPNRYILQFEHDPGFVALSQLVDGTTKFILCDDCRTALPYNGRWVGYYKEEGCPACGDCYPNNEDAIVDVE